MKRAYVAVKARDRGLCIFCGAAGDDIMHCLPRGRYPELKSDIRNLGVGCRSCHVAQESYQGRCDMLALLQRRFGYEYEEDVWQGYL